jgi:hypothetical protein
MSAISPENIRLAVNSVAKTMKEGGRLFFRDFADGDLTHERHEVRSAPYEWQRVDRLAKNRARCHESLDASTLFIGHDKRKGFRQASIKK